MAQQLACENIRFSSKSEEKRMFSQATQQQENKNSN